MMARRRSIVRLFHCAAWLVLGAWLVTRAWLPDRADDNEKGSRAMPVRAGTAMGQAAPRHRSASVPTRHFRTAAGESLVLALDEAIALHPDGAKTLLRLDPPATPANLGARLRAMSARPVAYPMDAERNEATRVTVTHRLRVQLAAVDLDQLLRENGLTLDEIPAHAPGWVVLSAADPFAALAAIEGVRSTDGVVGADVLLARKRFKRALPNDPLVSQQWHLANTNPVRTHANLAASWDFGGTNGVRGNGIRIGIVDDGIQPNHPDLIANIDTVNDRDWVDNTPDDASPKPAYNDSHGTACAGVAAARGNNALGVAGAAPAATLVSLRLVSDEANIDDADEAGALSWKNDIIQIKSNSWGPDDDGVTLEGPEPLTAAALAQATAIGRAGKGSIIVWAGGNGRSVGDNSNFDGYANSIHTIAVTATNSNGGQASYAEPGANLIVSAPSSGGGQQVTTTDLTGSNGLNSASGSAGDYATTFTGTSAATPLVAGVAALMLEKNPALGWRDVQEILIRSAYKVAPEDADWSNNAAGLHFNHKFGAGLVDATAAVNLAASWVNLPAQISTTATTNGLPVTIPDNSITGITRTFSVAEAVRVEHATLRLSITHAKRRDLEISLTSPSGMVSRLSETSTRTGANFSNWTFNSVRHWGETSTGTWRLSIADRTAGNTGVLTAAELKLFGSSEGALNQSPVITDAILSATGQGYTDTPLSVASITAEDPEGDPLTYAYQWQSSTDGIAFLNEWEASATLAPDPSRTGKLWRCVITPHDGSSQGPAFTTAAVNLLARPPASATIGETISYTSGLVLEGNSSAITRSAIVNEFSQGPAGGTAEWVEILTLRRGSLRYWDLSSNGRLLVFQDTAVWENLPAGTLVLIYNGQVAKAPGLPPDNTNPANGPLVISSTNSAWFDPDPDYDLWIDLSNSGDLIELNNDTSDLVHGFSFGSNSDLSPRLPVVGSGQSAHFTAGRESDADLATAWTIVPQASATPGVGNTPANTAFIEALRSGLLDEPARFRIASGSLLPDGLALNETTGTLAGTLAPSTTSGEYPITIERHNALSAVVSQSFILNVIEQTTFATWIAGFGPLADPSPEGDPDADGLPNLVEYALNLDPSSSSGPSAIVAEFSPPAISLTYRVFTRHGDVALTPEWSTSPDGTDPWRTAGILVDELETTADTRLFRASLTIDPMAPLRFLRLRASFASLVPNGLR